MIEEPQGLIEEPQALMNLRQKVIAHTAIVGVVGLGYVGLPFAVEKAKVGYKVLGIEQNPLRTEQVNMGESYIADVTEKDLKSAVSTGKLQAINNFERIHEIDVIVICVPTPLTKNLTPNLSYIENVTNAVANGLRPGQLVTLESTTYPGTTDEIMRPILEQISGLKQGQDFFLAHSPERVDPGNKRYTTKNTNKVVGASDPNSLAIAKLFYEQTIEKVVPVNSAKAAELVKVFENTFRAVNIALVNELALLCDRMDLNVWEVLDAANTKPFGIMPFYPGPGVGGHCIPLDPHYLEWKAKEFNFETHFIALAGEINRRMPEFVREKTWRALNNLGVAPANAKVLMIGVAYKKDLGDWRESPAIHVINNLLKDGIDISYHDPYVPSINIAGKTFESISLISEIISTFDLVIITTDHTRVDYISIVEQAKAVLDTRGITRHLNCASEKVTLL
ncbi:nucleotide sugar dehydrogenase [Mastigocoleus sp. MO_188.B34]|uniref:nucleotide sugar dehydrogenase n=1 Tax=Mastigocoleus sp. MO_188.B34 TaxID=3036635 RepID=UPI002610CBBE|nr:nucleotide sugar dehydrogenase [Mastigocoleus sp. MO_188.B34]MDJ0697123.1 nucleotide sugar dehydrogenase [Mastigocoleus sp. MO_188.B34]